MASILVVHGIGQQYLGSRSLHGGIASALLDGVRRADGPSLTQDDVEVAFYGHWFRPAGAMKGEPAYSHRDITDPDEIALLQALWEKAARVEPDTVPPPDVIAAKAMTPRTVQRALHALSRSRFLAGTADRFLIGVLKQVRLYLGDPTVRRRVQREIAAAVRPDTRVVVGHSLGSVVAYEALCTHPEWPVTGLVTIGSPLGIPHLVFDRLRPAPVNGRGACPEGVRYWANVCDPYDVVALVKSLAPLFGDVDDIAVNNGWRAHAIERHLTSAETGGAITRALG